MKFTPLPLSGSYQIDLEKREDIRGFFARQYCETEFREMGLNTEWVQMNTSFSVETGTVRGLHFQREPKAETKMVRCLKGAIFDVIVDLRQGSETFGQWDGIELSEENRTCLYIPKGFAHGFQTLRPDTDLLYWHSVTYSPEYEGGLNPECKSLAIKWPLPVTEISERDRDFPHLDKMEAISL